MFNESTGFQALVRYFDRVSCISEDALSEGVHLLSASPSYAIGRHRKIVTEHCYECGRRIFTDAHICEDCAKDDIPF